ncbi:hypothetical protein [Nostoc sp. MS1]|uniref:hypothetical protein n=1 Tax=Nostoc sp. MS1 TaxID=2764711 RepID=UPI001CC6C3FE|nr:hypothetical protein [Nostoc sp. MS1]BCL35118.1 hypothetical protein NSMS1_15650 [Nostoc sp. MS1]
MDSTGKENFFTPSSDIGGTPGYAGSAFASNAEGVGKTADKYLNDSLVLNQLTERVYQLLLEDMRIQRERVNYGHQRW